MATLLKADGTEHEVEPANGTDFSLEELHSLVGSIVETVRPFSRLPAHRRKILVVHEEGKIIGLPVNAKASEIYSAPFDVIMGDALLCEEGEVT